MPHSLITGLRSIELGVVNVPASEQFYRDVWGLAVAAREGDAVYLRGSGSAHHLISVRPHARTELIAVTLNAATSADVDQLHERLRAKGVRIERAPAAVDDPCGGYGFAFRDPEGRVFRVVAGDVRHGDALDGAADRPDRLSHVVFNATDPHAASRFFTDTLGFTLSDRTMIMDFVRCNRDHHSIAFARGEAATLNHIAFNMPDLESVMRGSGRLKDAGYPIEWGVGRHGPGHNVFAYFIAPGDVVVEYTAEVEQVDDTYAFHGPEYWTWPPGRIDHWGISAPPSARMKLAQSRVAFA